MEVKTLVKTEKLALVFADDNPDEPTPEADRTLNLVIDPSKMTPAREAEIEAANEDDSMVLVEVTCEVVKEWDLLDGGQPVPLTIEALSHQPTVLLMRIMNQISVQASEKAEAEGKA